MCFYLLAVFIGGAGVTHNGNASGDFYQFKGGGGGCVLPVGGGCCCLFGGGICGACGGVGCCRGGLSPLGSFFLGRGGLCGLLLLSLPFGALSLNVGEFYAVGGDKCGIYTNYMAVTI